MKRLLMVLMAIMLVGTLIAGCGGGSGGNDSPQTHPVDPNAVIDRQTFNSSELIVDSNFPDWTQRTGWYPYHTTWDTSKNVALVTPSFNNEWLEITIGGPNSDNTTIEDQLIQYEGFDLQVGKTYTLEFKYDISIDKQIKVQLQRPRNPGASDYSDVLNLGALNVDLAKDASNKVVSVTWKPLEELLDPEYYKHCKLVFFLGDTNTYTMKLDYVKLTHD